jgi:hypothetical protein
MGEAAPYNPLEKRNLGASVAEALLSQQPMSLGELAPFPGAGVYALYYKGSFAPYKLIAEVNQGMDPQAPIYVGKAIPAGGRRGASVEVGPATRALFRRLKEHAESIEAATNLELSDFACRFLVVDDIWIPLGESLLIAKFSPLWWIWQSRSWQRSVSRSDSAMGLVASRKILGSKMPTTPGNC